MYIIYTKIITLYITKSFRFVLSADIKYWTFWYTCVCDIKEFGHDEYYLSTKCQYFMLINFSGLIYAIRGISIEMNITAHVNFRAMPIYITAICE